MKSSQPIFKKQSITKFHLITPISLASTKLTRNITEKKYDFPVEPISDKLAQTEVDFFLRPFHEILGTNLPAVTEVATTAVQETWLSNLFNPVLQVFCEVLIKLHEITGWNYWAVIVALTVSTRALLIPVTARIFASNIQTRNLAPEMYEFTERMKVAAQNG